LINAFGPFLGTLK